MRPKRAATSSSSRSSRSRRSSSPRRASRWVRAAVAGRQRLEALAEAQKEIIVATWKLDARARRARDARLAAGHQGRLARRSRSCEARRAGGRVSVARDRRSPPSPLAGAPAPGARIRIGRAVEAMGRAVDRARQARYERRAAARDGSAQPAAEGRGGESKRRQVTRQQQAGGGGGDESLRGGPLDAVRSGAAQAAADELRDAELRPKRSRRTSRTIRSSRFASWRAGRTRSIASSATSPATATQIEEEELKRQLERLTREQNELRQEAEQLARQMGSRQQQGQQSSSQSGQQGQQSQSQQGQGQGQGQQGQQGQQGTRQLREISEEMRNAATDLGRQDPEQASASGERASERLRDLEQQLQASPIPTNAVVRSATCSSRPDSSPTRSAALANEAARTARGPGRRRCAPAACRAIRSGSRIAPIVCRRT